MAASKLARVLAAGMGLAGLATALPARAHPYADYHIIESHTEIRAHHLTRTSSTVQVGTDPINRFQMVHVARNAHAHRGTLLLLPPISSGFENYEVGDDGDYTKSFAGFFARRGYDVWGLSQRTENLAPGTCESGAVDCSAMANWGLQTLLDDAGFVRAQITAFRPWERPVVGGVSLGSIAGAALIDAHPFAYAGAILLEGAIYDEDPDHRAITAGFCDLFEDQLAAGIHYDGKQLGGMKLLASLATIDPDGPSPVPGFPAGFTNHQAFVGAMTNPGVSPLTPWPGYYFLEGNAATDSFVSANDALARANIATFTDYVALRTLRDVDCGLAGERTFTSRLHRFHGPVFVNAGGHGFGPAMLDTIGLMTHAQVTLNYVEPFGHMDHFFAEDHQALMEEPILAWLEDEVFGG
ncbi:Hypothetical protein A7982_06673 [Minicystis rosea]|nr:Hypothetical protein A7982_06673 [Minicystis rosea]